MASEGRVFCCYFLIGAALACSGFAFGHMKWYQQLLVTIEYLGVQAGIICCFYYYQSLALISFLALLSGFLLQSLYLATLMDLQMLRDKLDLDKSGIIYCFMGCLSGAMTCFFMALFESFYYTNRDVLYWVTINNTAIPAVLCFLASLTSFALWLKLRKMS